jgi:hypothetical protein
VDGRGGGGILVVKEVLVVRLDGAQHGEVVEAAQRRMATGGAELDLLAQAEIGRETGMNGCGMRWGSRI